MSEQNYDIMKEFGYLAKSVFPSIPFLAASLDDTTLVLLGTSLVDDFLKLALVSGFTKRAVSKRRVVQIFEGEGALATFSAKISLSTLLGLTISNAAHDLTILRKIRNRFAHSHERLYLREFPACLALKMVSKLDIADDVEERRKLKHSCAAIIGQLSTATLLRNAQLSFVTNNPDGVQKEYEAIIKKAEAASAALPE